MAKGGPYHKEIVMKLQESLYSLDDIDLEILGREKTGEPQTMPTEIEEFMLIKRENKHFYKCDSCPEKSQIVYFLVIGDTQLIKICPHCKRRLKRIINK